MLDSQNNAYLCNGFTGWLFDSKQTHCASSMRPWLSQLKEKRAIETRLFALLKNLDYMADAASDCAVFCFSLFLLSTIQNPISIR